MKKYSLTPAMLEVCKEYNFFSDVSGFMPLTSENIKEIKIGKKFAYSHQYNNKPTHQKLSKIIFENFLSKIPLNQSAIAYVKKKSYFDFIEPHRNNYFYLRIDLKDFFHSISEDLLKRTLSDYFSSESLSETIKQSNIDAIFNFLTVNLKSDSSNVKFLDKKILPIGFPLSPNLANIAFRKTDLLLEKLCDMHGVTYTRYADDMLFSSRGIMKKNILFRKNNNYKKPYIHSDNFLSEIKYLVSIDGFYINHEKTIKSVNTLSLNGYTISGTNFPDIEGKIRLSNKKTKIIEKVIHEININPDDKVIFEKCFKKEFPKPKYEKNRDKFINNLCTIKINQKLLGYRSYLISIIKFNNKFNCISKSSEDKYNTLLSKIENVIKKRIK